MSDDLVTRLAAVRGDAGLTQSALGKLVGVSRQTIGAIERGDWSPSTPVALRLAAALDCTVEQLFALPVDEDARLRSHAPATPAGRGAVSRRR